jgi:acetyltransferase-like isoleucine patch superfamily enzyme
VTALLFNNIVERLAELESILSGKRIVIFGIGKGGKLTLAGLRLLSFDAEFYLDNDISKQDKYQLGIKIYHPIILESDNNNLVILISSMYYDEISQQLDAMGFKKELDYYSIFKNPYADPLKPVSNEAARAERTINGVKIGKYSYGVEKYCKPDTVISSIGAFCSINRHALIGLHNHPTTLITTHPFLYFPKDILMEQVPNDLLGRFNIEKSDMSSITKNGEIIIGNDVWIGARAIVLPSVNIGNGVIIAAGAVVTNDVPDYAIVAGVPARILRYRFKPEEIKILNRVAWWDWSDEKIAAMADYLKYPDKFFEWYRSKTT